MSAKKKKSSAVTTLGTNKNAPQGKPERRIRKAVAMQAPGSIVVAACEEFTLYADGRVESSPDVRAALEASFYHINDASGSDARLELSRALQLLAEHSARPGRHENAGVCDALVKTLGKMLVEVLSVETHTVVGADGIRRVSHKETEKMARILADEVSAQFKQAVTHLLHAKHTPQDNRQPDAPPMGWTWALQFEAKSIFRETGIRPRKEEIREALEAEGYNIKAKDCGARWREKFEAAGLGNLPV